MIAFEIFLNGEKFCTAGVDADYGMLTAMLAWVKRDIGQLPVEMRSDVSAEDLRMTISGQKSVAAQDVENLQWPNVALKPGDDIRIRVVDAGPIDPPEKTKKIHPKYVKKQSDDPLLH